jgi:hypothetical protein
MNSQCEVMTNSGSHYWILKLFLTNNIASKGTVSIFIKTVFPFTCYFLIISYIFSTKYFMCLVLDKCLSWNMPFKLRLKKSRQYNVVSKSLFVICVELLDGTSIECTLSAESSGRECLDNVCQRLGLQQVCMWLMTH